MSERPRVGVFVCHCGKNIAGTVDPAAVVAAAEKLPDVVFACANIYTCSESGQAELKKAIKEHKIDRVVVAACSPKMHEPTFRACIADAGLNPYVLEMANIREHDSWVHMRQSQEATQKAMDLVKMAVAKARLLQPLEPIVVPVTRKAMVIGGGIAGLQAALDIAARGHEVILVEKSPFLGGKARLLDKSFPKVDCTSCFLNEKINKVLFNPSIRVLTLSEVTGVDGFVGNFKVKVRRKGKLVNEKCIGCGRCLDVCGVETPNEQDLGLSNRKAVFMVNTPNSRPCNVLPVDYEKEIHLSRQSFNPQTAVIDSEHCTRCGECVKVCPTGAIELNQPDIEEEFDLGAIVIAIGFEMFDAHKKPQYGYARYPNVVTSLELERMIHPTGPTHGQLRLPSDGTTPRRAAFIQCVGCRDDTANPYCARVCCMITLKQTILLKEKYPDMDVSVYYIDIRAGGKEYEAIYSKAKRLGVKFIRGRPSSVRPNDGRLLIEAEDTLSGTRIEEGADLVVLATGLQPAEDIPKIAGMLKIPRDQDGFLMEAHIKLKPVETVIDGVMVAGSCSGITDIPMSISRGHAAAAKILTLFSKEMIELEPITSFLIAENCKGCYSCTKMCPFQAIKPVEKEGKKTVQLITSSCKGCGTCVAGCAFGALDQYHFKDEQIMAQIDAALEENPKDKIVSFNCNWCSYAGADFAGVSRLQYPANTRIIRVMCSGRVSTKMVLRAFEKGAGMVLVAPCHPSDCHYISGNEWAKKRIDALKNLLPRKGINPDRLWFVYVSAAEGNVYQNTMIKMNEFLQKMKSGGVSWGGQLAEAPQAK